MGQSTDAILYYGLDVAVPDMPHLMHRPPEVHEAEWNDDPEWALDGWLSEHHPGVEVNSHGSCDYKTYFVAVSVLTAHRGYPWSLADDYFASVKESDKVRLDRALEALGVSESDRRRAGWRLASWVG